MIKAIIASAAIMLFAMCVYWASDSLSMWMANKPRYYTHILEAICGFGIIYSLVAPFYTLNNKKDAKK